jgi:hypothetical protein
MCFSQLIRNSNPKEKKRQEEEDGEQEEGDVIGRR